MTHNTNPDEYNGWVNRETAATALHLSNDESLYRTCTNIVAGSSNNMIAGEDIERFVRNETERVLFPTNGDHGDTWARLLISDVGSFWRVDWQAVAASFRES